MLNFKNLSEKQALTYTVIAAVILCIIPIGILAALQNESGTGFLSGLMDNPENLTTKVATLQKEKTDIEAILVQEKGLIEIRDDLNAKYNIYKKALPEEDNLEDFYNLIDGVLKGTKLSVKDWRNITHEAKKKVKVVAPPPAEPSKDGVPMPPAPKVDKEFPVNYAETIWKIEGNYQDILSFLHKVEDVDFERFVLVSDLQLTPINDPTNENNLEYMSASVTFVSFYYVKDSSEAAK